MDGKENILEELRPISGLVAEISRETPYGLPDGYFEALPGKVLARIRTGGVMLPERPAPLYSIPEGYFEGFAEKLMNRIKAGQTASSAPASVQTASEELHILSPLLSSIGKKMPFQIPDAYFDSFPAKMTSDLVEKMTNPEQDPSLEAPGPDSLSPLLAGLRDKQVYQAPVGYFAGLPDMILEKLTQQTADKTPMTQRQASGAKLIPFGYTAQTSRRRNWWKYSAAAAIAGLILTGGWLWTHTSVGPAASSIDISKTLPTVSDQDIENYLDTNNITNNVLPADEFANSTASLDFSDNDIKSFLGDVSDGELKQYIDEHGALKEPATN